MGHVYQYEDEQERDEVEQAIRSAHKAEADTINRACILLERSSSRQTRALNTAMTSLRYVAEKAVLTLDDAKDVQEVARAGLAKAMDLLDPEGGE